MGPITQTYGTKVRDLKRGDIIQTTDGAQFRVYEVKDGVATVFENTEVTPLVVDLTDSMQWDYTIIGCVNLND